MIIPVFPLSNLSFILLQVYPSLHHPSYLHLRHHHRHYLAMCHLISHQLILHWHRLILWWIIILLPSQLLNRLLHLHIILHIILSCLNTSPRIVVTSKQLQDLTGQLGLDKAVIMVRISQKYLSNHTWETRFDLSHQGKRIQI